MNFFTYLLEKKKLNWIWKYKTLKKSLTFTIFFTKCHFFQSPILKTEGGDTFLVIKCNFYIRRYKRASLIAKWPIGLNNWTLAWSIVLYWNFTVCVDLREKSTMISVLTNIHVVKKLEWGLFVLPLYSVFIIHIGKKFY